MKQTFFALLLILYPFVLEAEEMLLKTQSGDLYGSLELPAAVPPYPVVLILSGSGPTDRDGNSRALPGKNNSLKLLTEALAEKGIASLRFDKRGIGESAAAGPKEEDLRFGMYIEDAKGWVELSKKDQRFSSLTVLGHSEGSLVGMIAAGQTGADSFISIAGAGKPTIDIIRTQLQTKLPPELFTQADQILNELAQGRTVDAVPPEFNSIFRPSAQPYLISWSQYNPTEEIKKLAVPTLIVQGDTDIQVSLEEATSLHKAKPEAKLEIVAGMNHVLKEVPNDEQQQIASYSDPTLPVSSKLIDIVSQFILKRKVK